MNWLRLAGVATVFAIAINIGVTTGLTQYHVGAAMAKFEKASLKKGQATSGQPTAKSRAVVKPNPDLLFGVCVHNRAKGDLAVTLSPPPGYWSISIFANDGSTIYVANRGNSQNSPVALRLGAQPPRQPDGARYVVTNSDRSVVILRILPTNPSDMTPELAAQSTFRCTSVPA
jgi:uncharacterized membrane protein